MTDATTKPLALVTGVGPGTGAALARRFAKGGYRVAMLARDAGRLTALEKEIPNSIAMPCDVIGCGNAATFVHAHANMTPGEEHLCDSCFLRLRSNRSDLAAPYRSIQFLALAIVSAAFHNTSVPACNP